MLLPPILGDAGGLDFRGWVYSRFLILETSGTVDFKYLRIYLLIHSFGGI